MYEHVNRKRNKKHLFTVVVSGGHSGGWGRSQEDGQNLAYNGQH